MPFPQKGPPPMGDDDAEGAAIDMLVVGEPAAPEAGEDEDGGVAKDPQVLLTRIESDLAQLRQLIPAP